MSLDIPPPCIFSLYSPSQIRMKNRKKVWARRAALEELRSQSKLSKPKRKGRKRKKIELSSSSSDESSDSESVDNDTPKMAEAWTSVYKSLIPKENSHAIRRELIAVIASLVKEVDANATLTVYGSYAARLLLKGGDVDISVNVEGGNVDILKRIRQIMMQRQDFSSQMSVADDKDSLIGQYQRGKQRSSFDITVNNTLAPLSSRYLKAVGKHNPAIRKVFVIVKSYLKNHVLGDQTSGPLASVAICYLVVFFLQQTSVIQSFLKPKIAPTMNQYLEEAEEYENILPLHSAIGITNVLKKFFEFYTSFDFKNLAISIRDNKMISKRELRLHHRLVILDPFKGTRANKNVARSFNKKGLKKMQKAFKNALYHLKRDEYDIFK